MSARRVLIASLVGTTIEFFDFYIYATAAVLVFPRLFFPPNDAASAMLQSFATFALAFLARPIGSALFGHFGDRVGRKATLVAALVTMGVSTVLIGALPTYASVGIVAPVLLALCRLGQGLGLGGEWGGAVLLAIESAPPGKRAWYAMFPQLGAPLGFLFASGVFLILTRELGAPEFFSYGWRLPFLASALLVLVGLYVRLRLTETPAFCRMVDKGERVRLPMFTVWRRHRRALILGTLAATTTFLLFYLMTVFALSWGITALGFARDEFLTLQMIGVLFLAATIPLSALMAGRYGSWRVLMTATLAIAAFGLNFGQHFGSGGVWGVGSFLALGLALMGLTYGPLGSALSELFPTAVRYTGTSVAFNMAGILGAALTPSIAMGLAGRLGLAYVGYYLSAVALVTLVAIWLLGSRSSDADAATPIP